MVDVTVVLPIYNPLRKSETYLTDAIDSVLSQDYNSFELIIVDDGSTEDCSKIIDKYKHCKNVKFFRKKNGGQSSARNFGAKLGSGEYLAFIDQDDVWYRNRLKETVRYFKRNQDNNCIMVYSDLDRIDAASRIVCRSLLRSYKLGIHPKTDVSHILGMNAFVLPGTMLVKREQFLSIGGFNETLSGYEDDELALRFFQKGGLFFIDKPLIQWRIYQQSYSYTRRMDESRLKYYKILTGSYHNDKDECAFWIRDSIAPRFFYEYINIYKVALVRESKEQAMTAREGLRIVSKDLPFKKKIMSLGISAVPYSLARFIYIWRIHKMLRIRL